MPDPLDLIEAKRLIQEVLNKRGYPGDDPVETEEFEALARVNFLLNKEDSE